MKLGDGRSLSADAVVLAAGRPEGGMPESLERAFAPVPAAGTDGRVVLDPWAPGTLAALGARRFENVLVIGSGLTGVDVALHLMARGATVTLLSRHGALPHRFRDTGAPTELPNLDALGTETSLEELARRARRGSGLRPRRRAGLAAGDRCDAAADRAAVAVARLGGPAPIPARRPAAVGDSASPHAADDGRRRRRGDRERAADRRGG